MRSLSRQTSCKDFPTQEQAGEVLGLQYSTVQLSMSTVDQARLVCVSCVGVSLLLHEVCLDRERTCPLDCRTVDPSILADVLRWGIFA